jgi:hypothetical protein
MSNKEKLLYEIYKYLNEEGKFDEKLHVASELILESSTLKDFKPSKAKKSLFEIFEKGAEYEEDALSHGFY